MFSKIFVLLFKFYLIHAQSTQTVNYVGLNSDTVITNPERGFYWPMEVHSNVAYKPIDTWNLNNIKAKNITVILREFFLESFLTAPISTSFLTGMQTDFTMLRNYGFKCIVRFAYSDSIDNQSKWDATKAQVLAHITQLKNILTNNADVIMVLQAGFIGVWGEWYYTNNFGYPNPNMPARKEVVDALLSALPKNRMIQLRTPTFKRSFYGTSALTQNQAFQETDVSRVGHHNDCFLADATDYGTYQDVIVEKNYLEQDTKFTPMGGETCNVDPVRANCNVGVAEMTRFHWSYLNLAYHDGVIQKFKDGNCFMLIQNRLGYRYKLISGTYPLAVANNLPFDIQLKVTNEGFASTFNKRTVFLLLRNSGLSLLYSIPLKTDPRLWTSGVDTTIQETISLSNVRPGTYELLLNIPDESASIQNRPEYSIRLANDLMWEPTTGYNKLNYNLYVI